MAWKPDGSAFAIAGGARIQLYSADGKPTEVLEDPDGSAESLVWSPDGKWLYAAASEVANLPATVGAPHLVDAWDVERGSLARSWPPLAQSRAASQPDFAKLPRIPGLVMGDEELRLAGWKPVATFAISPDGRYLALGIQFGPILILDLARTSGAGPRVSRVLRSASDPGDPQSSATTHYITFNPEGTKPLCADEEFRDGANRSQLSVKKLADGKRRVFELKRGAASILALPGPDLARLATWTEDETLQLYDLGAAASVATAGGGATRLLAEMSGSAPPLAWSTGSRLSLTAEGILGRDGLEPAPPAADRSDGAWLPPGQINGGVPGMTTAPR